MAEQTYQRVCRVIGELSGLPVDGIGPGQSLGHQPAPNFYDRDGTATPIGLDSLDRVELAMKLETEFAIQLPDDEVDDLALDHVGGLCAFIQGKLDAKPRTYGDISGKLLEYCIEHPLPGATFTAFGVEIAPVDVLELGATETSACMFGSTENSGAIDVAAVAGSATHRRFEVYAPPGSFVRSAAERAMLNAERAQAELRRVFIAGFGMGKGDPTYNEIEANAAWHTFRQGNVVALGNCA